MEKIDFTGVSPEISEYISSLEKTIEDQSKRIDNLTEMLSKIQKGIYGQSSEKTRYVLGEDSDQVSLFNEAEQESNSNAPEPKPGTLVAGHTRKSKRRACS